MNRFEFLDYESLTLEEGHKKMFDQLNAMEDSFIKTISALETKITLLEQRVEQLELDVLNTAANAYERLI